MEEGCPPPAAALRAELEALKPSGRKKRAAAAGATEDEIEEAEDAADVVGALAELILAHEQPPPGGDATALRAELEALKPSGRKKRAVAAGATEEAIEEALDAVDPLSALAELILALEKPAGGATSAAALRTELEALKPSARKKRAVAAGASEEEIEEALDADDPIGTLVALVLEKEGGGTAEKEAALRVELEQLKPSARKKRAVAAGATVEQIDEALDTDDPISALASLILACGTAAEDKGEATLRAELEAMKKPSARKNRAVAAGATEEEIDEAGDADDPLAALVSLILAREKMPLRAHFAVDDSAPSSKGSSRSLSSSSLRSSTSVSTRDLSSMLGQKHVMLSCEYRALCSCTPTG
jgi:hypothetical protein